MCLQGKLWRRFGSRLWVSRFSWISSSFGVFYLEFVGRWDHVNTFSFCFVFNELEAFKRWSTTSFFSSSWKLLEFFFLDVYDMVDFHEILSEWVFVEVHLELVCLSFIVNLHADHEDPRGCSENMGDWWFSSFGVPWLHTFLKLWTCPEQKTTVLQLYSFLKMWWIRPPSNFLAFPLLSFLFLCQPFPFSRNFILLWVQFICCLLHSCGQPFARF